MNIENWTTQRRYWSMSISGAVFRQELFYQQEAKLPGEICCMTSVCSEGENEAVWRSSVAFLVLQYSA